MMLTYIVPRGGVKQEVEELEAEITKLEKEMRKRDALGEDSGPILEQMKPKVKKYGTITRFTWID